MADDIMRMIGKKYDYIIIQLRWNGSGMFVHELGFSFEVDGSIMMMYDEDLSIGEDRCF